VGRFAACAFLNAEIAAFAGDAVAISTSKSPSQPAMKPRLVSKSKLQILFSQVIKDRI
jgi:hypothetical protein